MLPNDECCGCSACKNICPKSVIKMKENSEGFLYPVIDDSKCIHCGLCKSVCPILNKKNKNYKHPLCYAVMADDKTREVSSSGGAFSVFANYVLEQKGFVCGCSFNYDKLEAEHIIISSKNDLCKLRGSKYVQSNIGDCYSKVKDLLQEQKLVLFTGTPCQNAGLQTYLGQSYDNLITLDILCHGVPSPKVYKKYLKNLLHSDNEKIINVNFRDKVRGWTPDLTHTTTTTTTTTYSYPQIKDDYLQLFLSNICLRKICTNCKYCNTQRPTNFTIADFWGIDKYDRNLNDQKGTSLLLINNEKAKIIFEKLKKEFKLVKPVPLKYAILGNKNLYSPHNIHPQREEFFKNLDRYSLKQLLNMYLFNKYDCGIMNYWASWNYGAILTCYALYEIVKNLGYTTQIINFRPNFWNNKREYPRNQAKKDFVNKYFNLTELCKNKKDLTKLNASIDTFIVGSDQVWNWGYAAKYIYFLDFVKNSKKKIACAASMVTEKFNQGEEVKTTIEYYMKRFDAISVREKNNVDFCKNELGTDVDWILDPVFILNKNNFEQLATNSSFKSSKEYIALYIFEYDNKIDKILNKLQEKYNLNIVRMNRGESIEDWLKIIRDAKFVITDSYHGTCFSIIFEKQFVSLCNDHGNSRFYSLLSLLNLEDRLFNNISEDIITKLETEINYKEINKKLNIEIDKSFNWLKNSLAKEKNKFKDTVESRLLNIILETGKIPQGKPYILRAFNKAKKVKKWLIRKIREKLYLITENVKILKY